MGIWDSLVCLALVLALYWNLIDGWVLVAWMVAWGFIMNHRRGMTVELCEREGHIPFRPFDSVDAVFCVRCDQQLPTRRPQYVSAAVAAAASEVDAARREKPDPQAKWSDRR